MSFEKFALAVHAQFAKMSAHELFITAPWGTKIDAFDQFVQRDILWEHYLNSFPAGTNEVFRVRRENDCGNCSNFVRGIGGAVAVIDGKIVTVWDVKNIPEPYSTVAKSMGDFLRSQKLMSVYRRDQRTFGAAQTKQPLEDGKSITWHHFHGRLADRHFTKTPGADMGEVNGSTQVFGRGMKEIKIEAIDTILELIADKEAPLYRGAEYKDRLLAYKELLKGYAALSTKVERNIYVFTKYKEQAARMGNSSMGTLMFDLSEGKETDEAVRLFEHIMSSGNFNRPKPVISKKQAEALLKAIADQGLEPSLERRFATLADMSVNNVLWVNGAARKLMKGGLSEKLLGAVKTSDAPIKSAKDITLDDFMAHVVPNAADMAVYLRNAQQGNFVSLTTAVHPDAPLLFRWDNSFAWSYDGNITDSVRERVKKAGGNVEGKLRFSVAWFNPDDLDIHVTVPGGDTINFRHRRAGGGHLDVDANGMDGPRPDPVENVAFAEVRDGEYGVRIHQYNKRTNDNPGFVFEYQDATGNAVQLKYDHMLGDSNSVQIGTFTIKNGEVVAFKKGDAKLVNSATSVEKWGVKTEAWTTVQTLMFSPNFWDENRVGNQHLIFALENCKNPEPTRGIYNEFLSVGMDKHRKGFEVLGAKTKCEPTDNQISGVGFSSTRKDKVLVRVVTKQGGQTVYNLSF